MVSLEKRDDQEEMDFQDSAETRVKLEKTGSPEDQVYLDYLAPKAYQVYPVCQVQMAYLEKTDNLELMVSLVQLASSVPREVLGEMDITDSPGYQV